jgi:hypothetical protein
MAKEPFRKTGRICRQESQHAGVDCYKNGRFRFYSWEETQDQIKLLSACVSGFFDRHGDFLRQYTSLGIAGASSLKGRRRCDLEAKRQTLRNEQQRVRMMYCQLPNAIHPFHPKAESLSGLRVYAAGRMMSSQSANCRLWSVATTT